MHSCLSFFSALLSHLLSLSVPLLNKGPLITTGSTQYLIMYGALRTLLRRE